MARLIDREKLSGRGDSGIDYNNIEGSLRKIPSLTARKRISNRLRIETQLDKIPSEEARRRIASKLVPKDTINNGSVVDVTSDYQLRVNVNNIVIPNNLQYLIDIGLVEKEMVENWYNGLVVDALDRESRKISVKLGLSILELRHNFIDSLANKIRQQMDSNKKQEIQSLQNKKNTTLRKLHNDMQEAQDLIRNEDNIVLRLNQNLKSNLEQIEESSKMVKERGVKVGALAGKIVVFTMELSKKIVQYSLVLGYRVVKAGAEKLAEKMSVSIVGNEDKLNE